MKDPRAKDIFQLGQLLNNTYRVEAVLGRGGLSEVYLARSTISGRVVAIKALRAEFSDNDSYTSLITREEGVREIRHDAVVRYFDTQRTPDGIVYLVMDYIEGKALDIVLREGGMSMEDVLAVGERVLAGLADAHRNNIVHRDIAPDNIILRAGDPRQAVIIDFGIAKDTTPDAVTIVGEGFAGKLGYAAPEQFGGHTDPRSDIYALGAALLATYLGKKPNMGKQPMEVLPKKMQPLDTEGVPEPLRMLILRMTEPDAKKRFQTADEAVEAFKRAQNGTPLHYVLDGPPELTVTESPTVRAVPPQGNGHGTMAPGTVPPGTMPPGSFPPGTMPPGTFPPGTMPPGTFPPGTMPPGTMPPSGGTWTMAPDGTAHWQTAVPQPPKRGKGLWIGAGLLAVAAVAGGAWYVLNGSGGSRFPEQSPFELTVSRGADGAVTATGFVPSPAALAELTQRVEALGGTAELSLGSGALAETWPEDVISLLGAAATLEEFEVALSDNRAEVTGLAEDRAALDAATKGLDGTLYPGLDVQADLLLGPRVLTPGDLSDVIDFWADCGALTLQPPQGEAYALGDTLRITGTFAAEASRAELETSLTDRIGSRSLQIDADVLNDMHCRIDEALPPLPAEGMEIAFGSGDDGGARPDGIFRPGDNPTIDVGLPEGSEGYMHVILVDVQGVVYNLLPNRLAPEHSVAALRETAEDGRIRVAFSEAVARAETRVAFRVDDSVIGRSRVVAFHTREPLFEGNRKVTETLDIFLQDLVRRREAAPEIFLGVQSAILETRG
ncbi:serine/threonine protein kinase [Sagittula sp. P11]|uniref:serine/threonine protein kinase n=1 Tax=Sagittula sp. P11 TaxID=2009329 RepID=UPI0018E249FB|nr:serine/threonine protein kinase [Sagittula sp. P11]